MTCLYTSESAYDYDQCMTINKYYDPYQKLNVTFPTCIAVEVNSLNFLM